MVKGLIAGAVSSIIALAASSVSAAALAQTPLTDPTKPPGVVAARPGTTAEGSVPAASKLQTILVSPHRKLAVIDGQTVALGERVGDAILVRITESEVTLKRGERFETLRMYPQAQAGRGERK